MKTDQRFIEGGVTTPLGFKAATIRAGIKESRKRDDLSLLVSDVSATVAGTFTSNRVKAPPVKLCERNLIWGQAQAIIINAGCANACTGEQGFQDAERMAELTAATLNIGKNLVFVCSTGTIGIPLPMNKIESALPALAKALSPTGGAAVAEAILTTDLVKKEVAVTLTIGGKPVTIAGITKGSGMIAPNMATMLAFITTDAAVDQRALQDCLRHAVDLSFNRIIVDGDESTNDTVLMLANGVAGTELLQKKHADWKKFCHAVETVCHELAIKIVKDGEGATKFVTVTVTGAATRHDALVAARAIAKSALVKTAWNGGDPNWGRLMCAIGYSGARIEEGRVNITFDDVCAVQGGKAADGASLKDLEQVYAKKEFTVTVDLQSGKASHTVYTCDLSKDYVAINAEYMT
ncbi:MAG: bifunctional glutamate N-acetyltransferase/amino-acid acetyltransferase ArgJ [bacterium]|jgi:glutamate N-acetyltransferase/amino-acid N-acetyltransferase